MCLFANDMNHAFAFPAKAGPHSTDPRDGRLSQPSWLVTYIDGLPLRRWSPIQVLSGPGVD